MSLVRNSIPRFTEYDAMVFVREQFGLSARARKLVSTFDQNFRLQDPAGRELVLKISNAEEDLSSLEFQNRVLSYLGQRLAPGVIPQLIRTESGDELAEICDAQGVRHFVRLLSYLPGIFLADVTPHTPDLLSSLGTFLGQLDQALSGFSLPVMERPTRWNLTTAPETVRAHVHHITTPEGRGLVEHFLAQFETHVTALEPQLRRGVIHNNATNFNVLVGHTRTGRQRLAGLINFGEVVHSYVVAELAVAAAYAMHGKAEPLEAAAEVVAGYHSAYPLTDPELVVLFDLIVARLALTVTFVAHASATGLCKDLKASSEIPAWQLLRKLVWVSRGAAYDLFRRACRMTPSSTSAVNIVPASDLTPAEILEKRRRHLAPPFSASYREPLKIARGFMQYLYDENGRAYLDSVSHTCHVGHCHPRVVKAAQDQMAILSTHAGDLHEYLVRYAERLTRTFPEPLRVTFFVHSGSEAIDLALRLARAHTRGQDVVIVNGAHHGHLTSLIELSPRTSRRAPSHAHRVPAPDVYRGSFKASDKGAGRRYGEHVGEAVESIRKQRGRPAAFVCETLLSGGQIPLPEGYLAEASRHIHDAGGVTVIDERDAGPGRAGRHFWAFEAQGIVPDIVTLGKPIGNGYPIAAVITTPEIAASLAPGVPNLNIYGGDPVSCAVGLSVLDVIADEDLQTNAQRAGAHLLEGLRRLAVEHPLIGDVRGEGLFLGVELVRDRETLEPATREAAMIVEEMKKRSILLLAGGPLENVLEIKPPLVFSRSDADRVVAALDEVLSELGAAVESPQEVWV